jgi:hypothetical protein
MTTFACILTSAAVILLAVGRIIDLRRADRLEKRIRHLESR